MINNIKWFGPWIFQWLTCHTYSEAINFAINHCTKLKMWNCETKFLYRHLDCGVNGVAYNSSACVSHDSYVVRIQNPCSLRPSIEYRLFTVICRGLNLYFFSGMPLWIRFIYQGRCSLKSYSTVLCVDKMPLFKLIPCRGVNSDTPIRAFILR